MKSLLWVSFPFFFWRLGLYATISAKILLWTANWIVWELWERILLWPGKFPTKKALRLYICSVNFFLVVFLFWFEVFLKFVMWHRYFWSDNCLHCCNPAANWFLYLPGNLKWIYCLRSNYQNMLSIDSNRPRNLWGFFVWMVCLRRKNIYVPYLYRGKLYIYFHDKRF